MQCINHPAAPATARCSGCADSFCANCLVEIHGQRYCIACKVMAIKGEPAALGRMQEVAMYPCNEARDAMIYACLGALCFIFAIAGLSKANVARQRIAADPRLAGAEMVRAATVIGWLFVGLFVMNFILRAVTNAQ